MFTRTLIFSIFNRNRRDISLTQYWRQCYVIFVLIFEYLQNSFVNSINFRILTMIIVIILAEINVLTRHVKAVSVVCLWGWRWCIVLTRLNFSVIFLHHLVASLSGSVANKTARSQPCFLMVLLCRERYGKNRNFSTNISLHLKNDSRYGHRFQWLSMT